jgi:tagatose 1,6-diphosphate aldolase
MGASAVKILVYYHPHAGEATEHVEETVRQIAEEAHKFDLPFFVEPVTYSPDADIPTKSAAFAQQRPTIIRETVERLQACGADVLKIEFPVDVAFDDNADNWRSACEAISEIATVPWALLSAGVDFSTFEKQVKIACQAGSSGFLGGRAIWKEAIAMNDADRLSFLEGTAIQRIKSLKQLVVDYGKAWTDYYSPMPAGEGWYHDYMSE